MPEGSRKARRRGEAGVKMPLTPDDPRHGQYRGYMAHQTQGLPVCLPCREAKRAYARKWDKARRNGMKIDESYVDAAPFRKHIERLARSGMSNADMGRAAGLGHDTIRRIRVGERQWVLLSTARKLARVAPGTFSRRRSPLGVRRRVQALVALGHESKFLTTRLGISPQRFSDLLHGRTGTSWVTERTWRDVLDLYADLSMKPGTSARSRVIAMRHGWPPPLAWDDIDDPNEKPQGWTYAAESRANLIRDFADQGATLRQACRHLRLSRATLQRWCERNGLRAEYLKLAATDLPPGFVNGSVRRVG